MIGFLRAFISQTPVHEDSEADDDEEDNDDGYDGDGEGGGQCGSGSHRVPALAARSVKLREAVHHESGIGIEGSSLSYILRGGTHPSRAGILMFHDSIISVGYTQPPRSKILPGPRPGHSWCQGTFI